MRRIRLHDLRHTHASLLFNDGLNIKMIGLRLGHSDAGTTMKIYAHLAPNAQDAAATAIDRLLGARPSKADAEAVN